MTAWRPPRARRSLVLVALAACGPAKPADVSGVSGVSGAATPPDAHRPPYERLQLAPTAPVPASDREPTVTRLVVPAEVPAERYRADSAAVVPHTREDGSVERVLRLSGGRKVWVDFPGPFPAGSFNQIAATVVVSRKVDVHVKAWARGKPILTSDAKTVAGRGVPQTVLFDLPRAMAIEEEIERVSVHFPKPHEPVGLISVSLIHKPAAAWLPAPGGPAELVAIGAESRRATGLSAGQPLEGQFDAARGDLLMWSAGVPSGLEQDAAGMVVRATLARPGSGLSATVERPLAPTGDWRAMEWRVPAFEGSVRVQFELVAEGEEAATCALAEPVVIRRGEASDGPRRAPVVLLVTSDTHRADHVGAARGARSTSGARSIGNARSIRTPTLDALAARGVLFEDCTSTSNITNPSHAALMTAVHPRDTELLTNLNLLSGEAGTLAETFRDAGWATLAAVSVQHLGHAMSGLGQGFDRMSEPTEEQRESESTLAALEAWLPDVEGVPLFVWFHAFDAHLPYEPPEELERLYYPTDKDPFSTELPPLPESHRQVGPKGVRDPDYIAALYASEVTYFDGELGRLLDLPRFAEAVVAVTADHGEDLGEHAPFSHGVLFPSTLRVPLILAWPGAPAGTRIARPIRQTDLARTLLDLAGLEDAPFPGENLLEEREARPRFALQARGKVAAMFWQDWFVRLHLHDTAGNLHRLELYDTGDDPTCQRDLVEEEPERAERLRQLVVDWLVDAQPAGWGVSTDVHDPEVLAQLARLGYATDVSTVGTLFDPECECSWCRRYP